MSHYGRLVHAASGAVVVERLELSAAFWSRFKGLQLRRTFPPGNGLLLVPCSSIHTCLVRFAIDIVMLDNTGRVLHVKTRVKPWRIVLAPRGTHAVLELPAGTTSLREGDVLCMSANQQAEFKLPPALAFLAGSPSRPPHFVRGS